MSQFDSHAKHTPRKRFGQHFLHDNNVLDKIVMAVAPKPEDALVEIGPGLGALTKKILPKCQRLDVIELDRDVIPHLVKECQDLGELIVHNVDVLKFDLQQLISDKNKLRIIGNLPYNISTPILFHLLGYKSHIQDMYFMLQKEVVERMVAQPGTKIYGRLSVMLQYHCEAQTLFFVKPQSFNPPPKVDSAVIYIKPRASISLSANNLEKFSEIVRTAFNQRRKMLRKSLHDLITAEQLQALGIDPQRRPETLSVDEFVTISNAL